MKRTANLVWSCVGLLTAGLLGGCGSSVEKAQNTLTVNEPAQNLTSLAVSDLTKPLVTGAMAELMALNSQQSGQHAIPAAQLEGYGSTSVLLNDPTGKPAGYLILMGPQVSGDLWSALEKIDPITAKQKGYFSAFVSAQPMFSGVSWLEQGVQGLADTDSGIKRLQAAGTLSDLVVLDNMSVAGKLKDGLVVRLNATLTPVSSDEVQRDATARNNFQNWKGGAGELQKVNATWSAWGRSLTALQKLGGVQESFSSSDIKPVLGQAGGSHIDFSVLVKNVAGWQATQKPPVALGGQSLITAQSIPGRTSREVGSASCGWFGICAYQYNSNISGDDAVQFAGGAVQLPQDYDAFNSSIDANSRYRAQIFLQPGVYGDSLLGCSAAALISMADWYWRVLGVKWYGYPQISGTRSNYDFTMRPYYPPSIYNTILPYLRFEKQVSGVTYDNHPGVRLGRRIGGLSSEAMDLMSIQTSGGNGQNVTSNTHGGMINFLAKQKLNFGGYLGTLGYNLQVHGGYNDIWLNILNGGSMAGVLREAFGWQSLPVLVMYPSPQGGGHTSLVLNYSVYYPVVGSIQISVITVDHPDTAINAGNAFSVGMWSWY